MENNNIVINTLVFLEDLKNGEKQSKLLKDISSLGIKKVEVRREFIKDFETELEELKAVSEELEIELYYSVPKHLYVNGELKAAELEQYFKEANKINSTKVKLNIGNYNHVSSEDAVKINSLCHNYGIKLTVENDQTEEGGKVQKIKEFLDIAKDLGIKVSCTFDVGNWYWVSENPKENAELLKEYVTYVHLKDVLIEDKPRGVLLDEGIVPWREIIGLFEQNTPVAIEYPIYPNTLEILNRDIKKLQEIS